LKPDVVTVCIGWNDRTLRAASDRETARRLRLAPVVETLADHWYLYRALSNLYATPATATTPAVSRDHARVPPDEYRENLRALVREAQTLGARTAFIALPHRSRVEGPPLDPAYPKALWETATAIGVPLVDVGVLGDGAPSGGNERYFIDSLHFSPAGAEELARELARQLGADGLL
jgi:lysophospholipase L1-like esterase